MRIGKKMIEVTDVENTEKVKEEAEMEEKIGFFAKHKKGVLIGAGVALLATIGGLMIANRNGSDDFEDYEDDNDFSNDTPNETGSAEEAE